MIKHLITSKDTYSSLVSKYGLKNEYCLKLYHNLHCDDKDLMQNNLTVGNIILIPEEPEFLEENLDNDIENEEDINDFTSDFPNNANDTDTEAEENEEDSASSSHNGKHFVIQKGTCQCDKGFKFPQFKVTSHKKHYWNDSKGEDNYLAVTEEDVQLNPPAEPFGKCKLRPSASGYLPCVYAPAGKWQKTYDKVKVLGKSCVTEISELMCTTGGKITVQKHGQQAEASKGNVNNANTNQQQVINPIIDFDEFKERVTNDNIYFF